MFTPRKELGQNFLTDKSIVFKMVDSLELSPGDEVVEIGAGLGALTTELAERSESLGLTIHAVEIDLRFAESLNGMFLQYSNVGIIEANVLDWLPFFTPKLDYKVIGSLPYYITSPILHTIVKHVHRPKVCTVLIQKEVAEKIRNKAPDASYLSSFIQTFYDVEYLGKVDRKQFHPSPGVDSGIIKMVRKDEIVMSPEDINKYEGFLHKGFASPRKKINKVFSKDELSRIGISGDIRPQNLDAPEWLRIFRVLTA
jgi:16S rRNA (adenine1518-N6/adenine1519-N6)-dimethyltransferase